MQGTNNYCSGVCFVTYASALFEALVHNINRVSSLDRVGEEQ